MNVFALIRSTERMRAKKDPFLFIYRQQYQWFSSCK